MAQRTRKLMAMHKALYPTDDIDYMYQEKEEGRGFYRIQNSVETSKRRLEDCLKKDQRKANYNDQKQHQQHKDQ